MASMSDVDRTDVESSMKSEPHLVDYSAARLAECRNCLLVICVIFE